MKMLLPRRVKRRMSRRVRYPLEVKAAENSQWAFDLMHATLYYNERVPTLNVFDEATRECLAIEVDT